MPNEVRGHLYLLFIQVDEGEESCLFGFMSLHDDVANLNKLYISGHKFKNILLLVQMRLSLYQSSSSQKEESNAIIISIKRVVPRWNLALVSNFNTPCQLGRIVPANPSIIIDYHAIMLP